MPFRLNLSKETFKFSVSHFTILSPTEAERLHGHNYYVQVSVELESIHSDLGMAFDFNEIKPVIKNICEQLDEYTLIPQNSPYVKTLERGDTVEVTFGDRKYSLPAKEVRLLPVSNITSEELARYIHTQLSSEFKTKSKNISVTVQETQGQSVTYFL